MGLLSDSTSDVMWILLIFLSSSNEYITFVYLFTMSLFGILATLVPVSCCFAHSHKIYYCILRLLIFLLNFCACTFVLFVYFVFFVLLVHLASFL